MLLLQLSIAADNFETSSATEYYSSSECSGALSHVYMDGTP